MRQVASTIKSTDTIIWGRFISMVLLDDYSAYKVCNNLFYSSTKREGKSLMEAIDSTHVVKNQISCLKHLEKYFKNIKNKNQSLSFVSCVQCGGLFEAMLTTIDNGDKLDIKALLDMP